MFPKTCHLQEEGIHHGELWALGASPLLAPQGLACGVLGERCMGAHLPGSHTIFSVPQIPRAIH